LLIDTKLPNVAVSSVHIQVVVDVQGDRTEQVRENNYPDCATGDSFTPRVENAIFFTSASDTHTSTYTHTRDNLN